MFADQRLGVAERSPECGDSLHIPPIAQCHGHVALQATPFGTQDGATLKTRPKLVAAQIDQVQ
jgi:hypothetical protein